MPQKPTKRNAIVWQQETASAEEPTPDLVSAFLRDLGYGEEAVRNDEALRCAAYRAWIAALWG